MRSNRPTLDTRLIHAGEPRPRIEGAVSMPVFQSATYLSDDGGDYHEIRYIRLNNTPNHLAVQAKLASLEGAEAALVTASGMSAITTTLLTVLSAGDHLLAQSNLYGGTHGFVTEDLQSFGISFDFIDGGSPRSWSGKLRPSTRAVYVESMTNPLLEVADLRAVVAFCREHGLTSIIDNTFASPVNFRPLDHGFDLSLHSATKYLNGHHDVVAGAVVGGEALVRRVKHRLDHNGGSLDPHACQQLHRGMKTLALRVRRQNENASALADMLSGRAEVSRVNYPGLGDHPQHERARALFDGFGGVLSFELGGGQGAARRLLENLTLPAVAPSLGGVESLITLPALTSHAGLSPEERKAIGIADGLVRVAVGIEGTRDLLADFESALEAL